MNGRATLPANTQVDLSRKITVEFDTNVRGPWHFAPAERSLQVNPGELVTVMFEFQNIQDRKMSAQAIPAMHHSKLRHTSTSLSVFVSISTRWRQVKRNSGLLLFTSAPKFRKTLPP